MVLINAIASGTCTATARSVENDSLQEERIVVEVVLHEEDIALSLVPGTLYHDVQGTLYAHAMSAETPISNLPETHVLVHVQERCAPRILDLEKRVRVLLDSLPASPSAPIPSTARHALATRNRHHQVRRPLSVRPAPGHDNRKQVGEPVLIYISELDGNRNRGVLRRVHN